MIWPFERATIDHDLGRIAEHVRRDLGHVFVVLVAALPHHIQEQRAPLRGVDDVLDRRREWAERLGRGRRCRIIQI